jgi:hypothetical protein
MKGYIYAIHSHQTTEIYIGSTTQILCNRMAGHRRHYKSYLDGKFAYVTSFEIVKFPDAYIELIEEVEFENKQALYAREGFHIREMKCVNKCIMGRTDKEYREDNKEEIAEYQKEYRDENKAEIKEKQNVKCNCECGGKYQHSTKSRHLKTKKHQEFLKNKPII